MEGNIGNIQSNPLVSYEFSLFQVMAVGSCIFLVPLRGEPGTALSIPSLWVYLHLLFANQPLRCGE